MGLRERLLNQKGGERPYKEVKKLGRRRDATRREDKRGEKREKEKKKIRVRVEGGDEEGGMDGMG